MNQYDLNGRVALITGGGSGLGRGIGQALAELGAIVVAADIQTEPAEEAEPGILMYFSQPGESLWDIAKRYRVSCDSLKRMNPDLEENGGDQPQRVILWRK